MCSNITKTTELRLCLPKLHYELKLCLRELHYEPRLGLPKLHEGTEAMLAKTAIGN